MASGCDQCMQPVGVWVQSLGGALNDMISGQCVFKA